MEVRLLGAHNLETRGTRHTCFLIDGVLGVDAGSLMTALTGEERLGVRALLLTHRHFDHTRDIPSLGLAILDKAASVDVYALPDTLQSVREHMVNGAVYPDFVQGLNGDAPKFRFHPVTPNDPFRVLGYEVRAIPVPHPAPAVGYVVRGADGMAAGFTGDTGGQLLPFLREERLQVLFVDVTWPSSMSPLATLTGHMTPALLGKELAEALEAGLRLPRIVAVHVSFEHHAEVRQEVVALSHKLGVDITVGHEDMIVAEGAVR